jgi:hypothetical protein
MIERLANKLGARVDPTFSWGSLTNTITALVTLAGVVGGYYVMNYRMGQVELMIHALSARQDSDHDLAKGTANDVQWLRGIVQKRSELGMPHPFDPTPTYAMHPAEGRIAGTAAVGVRGSVD